MKEFWRRHLPHWQPQEAVFFVTFRLKDSLPHKVIEFLWEERERIKAALHKLPVSKRAQQNKLDEEGYFWQDESYDRVIRDHEEYVRTVNYVLENPVKVGLVSRWGDRLWAYCK